MHLYLTRRVKGPKSTIGTIEHDGRHLCYTCEDVIREPDTGRPGTTDHGALEAWTARWKVKGKTAIPTGVYRLAWTRSTRFQKMMLEVLAVPGFQGIRIHAGNTEADTEGCILPGLSSVNNEAVRGSRPAVEKLERLIVPAIQAGEEVWLHVENNIGEQRSPA
jgi:hypothetical protein